MNNAYRKAGKSALASLFASALILTGCEKENFLKEDNLLQTESTPNNSESLVIAKGMEYVPNQVLVKFRAGMSESAKANALARINGKAAEKILTKTMQHSGDNEGITVVNTPLAALEAVSRIKGGAEIEYVEPNYIYTHTAISNDTYFTNGSLWGMKGGFGSNAEAAWAAGKTGSSTVYIGIIDEGVMYTHPDLANNMKGNLNEVVGNGLDDDGNGFIDDKHGYDFDRNDASIFDGPQDDHGTHVAGTIGGVGGNAIGVAGVSWNVQMLSAKFLGRNGGTTANAIKAVDYFTNLKTKSGLNIVATSNSWGGGGYSQGLYDAIKRANDAGILFIAAAGNGGSDGVGDNNDATPHYPSSYNNANIIAVASITNTGAKSGFSNFGLTSVDIGAPGSGIYSTLPAKNGSATYGSYSGTSMATPHVSGAVALYASVNPGSTAAAIKTAILSSAVPTTSMSNTVTKGRLDANAALLK